MNSQSRVGAAKVKQKANKEREEKSCDIAKRVLIYISGRTSKLYQKAKPCFTENEVGFSQKKEVGRTEIGKSTNQRRCESGIR